MNIRRTIKTRKAMTAVAITTGLVLAVMRLRWRGR